MLDISQGRVSQIIRRNIDNLINGYVSSHLGRYAFTPRSIKNSVPGFVRKLFPSLQLVTDATYLYIQRSTDFGGQKKRFSGQKKKKLSKN